MSRLRIMTTGQRAVVRMRCQVSFRDRETKEWRPSTNLDLCHKLKPVRPSAVEISKDIFVGRLFGRTALEKLKGDLILASSFP